jgi:REP-associated tyrosine transposase
MYKPRLRRLDRIYPPNPIYFVTACTHARQRLLDNDEIHRSFSDFFIRGTARGALVGRYVVMPDHFHLFVALQPGGVRLSGWMKSLKNSLSRVLREMDRPVPHWQDGFFDHILRSSESYKRKWRYVRENPVRAGLVPHAHDWPYQGEIHRLQL